MGQALDSLSTEPPEEVLFEVYDEILKKHGFRPLEKPPLQGETTVPGPAETLDSPHDFEALVSALYAAMGYTAD